jgi:hypothetical protein
MASKDDHSSSAKEVAAVDKIESIAFMAGWLAKARSVHQTWEEAFLAWRREVEEANR